MYYYTTNNYLNTFNWSTTSTTSNTTSWTYKPQNAEWLSIWLENNTKKAAKKDKFENITEDAILDLIKDDK